LTSKLHGGSVRPASSRRSLLALGATGLLAGGMAVVATDLTSATPADAATLTGTTGWINVVTDHGADPSGVNDSTAAFQAAIASFTASSPVNSAKCGVVYIPAGTYTISSTLTCTTVPVYFVGDGAWATTVSYTGSGDCFRVYDSSTYGTRTKFSGGIIGITIDGAKATGAATGLHVGDLLQYEVDLTVQNFQQGASIGVHFDNQYYWTEQMFGRIYASSCTKHVVFDWTSSTSTTSSGSFERCDLDIYIDQDNANFDGVVFQNGAFVTNGSLKIRGNFGYSTAAVTSAALRLTGSQTANGYSGPSGIVDSMIDIGVECGRPKTGAYFTPQTIAFGTTGANGNSISNCVGLLNFGAAGNIFAQSNSNGNVFNFIGQTGGDPTLPGGWATYGSGFPTGITGHVAFRFLPTGNEVMVSWAFDIASGTTLDANTTIATVATKFSYNDNKLVPGNNSGGGLSGNVYAPASVSPGGVFKYSGPSYTSSGPSWWYGQGVYTLSLG
jgi:Pectate lyase superfamily protein